MSHVHLYELYEDGDRDHSDLERFKRGRRRKILPDPDLKYILDLFETGGSLTFEDIEEIDKKVDKINYRYRKSKIVRTGLIHNSSPGPSKLLQIRMPPDTILDPIPSIPRSDPFPSPPPMRDPLPIVRPTKEFLEANLPVVVEISWDDVEPRVIHCSDLDHAMDLVSIYLDKYDEEDID